MDQSILWVSDSFANYFELPSTDLVGRSIFELLEGSPSVLWQQLFTGIESVDERFDEIRISRAGEPTDDLKLRAVRYVDGGRHVMISLRSASSLLDPGGAGLLAEVELRHSELLRGSFDGVVVHDGVFVVFVNDVAAGLMGVASADAVGMRIESLINPKRDIDIEIGDGADEDSGARRMRMLLRRASGELVEVDASMALVSWRGRRAVQIVFHDLSLKRHSQRSDAVRDLVEDAVSDAIVTTDENLRIVDWNRSASELYGWSPDEVVGMSIGDVLGPADDSLGIGDNYPVDTGARSDAWMGTVSHRHRDGHELSVESAQIVLRDSDGGAAGLLEVNRPVDVVAVDDSTTEEGQRPVQPDDAAFVTEARAAVANGEISVAYQPIVELGTNRLHKVEALARWTHPERGAIHPGQFIPLAERSGIIDELGEWILERACSDVLRMDGEGIDVELSVNVSVVQLRDPAVSQRIARLLTDTGFPPTRLWIEVTESVLLDDRALLPLKVLHDMGVRLVVDDFGTGYATFQYITRLPVDALKIDTTFVSGLGIDARDTAIVRSVINLSRDLGLEVVAEGVETEFQRSQLLALQCRFGQGWLFGRPVPFADLVTRYRSSAPVVPAAPTGPADDEATRLTVLRASRILDTDPELTFDSLVQLSSQLLSTPMAVISFVDADRQWFKARVGVEATEAPRDMFCAQVLAEPLVALIVADAPGDPRFAESYLVTGPLNVRAYAGAPIRSREGLPLGVLSVLDIRPRDFTAEQVGQLQLLAEQVAALIDLRRSAAELDDFNHRRRPSGRGAGTETELLQPINTDAAQVGAVLIDLGRMSVERDTGTAGVVDVLRYGSLEIDLGARTVAIDSLDLEVTAKEFDLLAFLATRPGHVFSRDELLTHIWGSSKDWQDQATVTEHIYRLRKKIEPDRSKPRLLRTVRGRGYCFGPPTVAEISGVEALAAPPRSGRLVHVDGRILAADDSMVVLLAAKDSDDIVGGHIFDYIAASSQPAARARLEIRASGHEPGTQVITLRAADGRELPVLMTTVIGEFDGAPAVIATVQEILDPPQLIRQLVTGVTSEISDAVIVTDPLLHVVSWNAAAHRLYGWSEVEVLGHTMLDVIPTLYQQPHMSTAGAWEELQSTGRWNQEVQQVARDGSIVSVLASVNLIRDEQGLVAGIVAVNRPTSSHITMANRSDEAPTTLQPGSARADAAFDALVRLAALAMSAPIASIAIVAGEGETFAASVGVAAGQTPGDATFSAQATTEPDEVFVVADAAIDARFADDPFVVGPPLIRSYAGISIRNREGLPLGTLCVLDTQPRPFTVDQVDLLKALAVQAGALIDLGWRTGEVDDLTGMPGSAAVAPAPTAPTSPRARRLTPTAKLTAVDPEAATARLAASRSLLRVDTVEAAVGVCIALVRELGGRTIPGRLDDGQAIPIDCSFGHGEPLLPVADSALARLRLERVLPEVLEDARVVISRIRQSDDLHEQARTDPLTGLMNRRAVDRLLKRRTDDVLVAIDLDHFKSVNDTWGHAAGDDVLIAYSRALRGSGRASDRFARLGGEELLAVLGGANEEGLSAFLGRLHETWLATRPYEVTYSAGCAWGEGRSGTETLNVADAALFRAKQTGRDRAVIEPRDPAIVARTSHPPDTPTEGTS